MEEKIEDKKEEKKEKIEEKTKQKKEIAIVRGISLPISFKHAREISRFILGKNPEKAIEILKKVQLKKIAVPMRGEIPHRKGIASGRYPVKAAAHFVKLLKNTIGNARVAGLEGELVIKTAIANKAPKSRHGGARHGWEKFKRAHVTIIVSERKEQNKK